MKTNSIDFILSHFKDSTGLFPRKMMTYCSKGLISINSEADILKRCREADSKECLINAYPEILENNGTLIQPPNFILIDLDLSLCKTCVYPIRKLDYLLKQTLMQIKKEIHGHPTVLWTGNGYHVYLPVQVPILDTESEYLKGKYKDPFSVNGRYHDYYVSEVFMQFAERYLTEGKSDPSHQRRFINSMVRIPDTFNINSLSKGMSLEKSKVKVLQEWDGKMIGINSLIQKFQAWLTRQ